MLKITIMKKLFKLIKSKTPGIGKKIKNIGLGLLGISAAPEMPGTGISESISNLPEVPQTWIRALQIILAIVGLFMAGAGSASTTGNPDEIVKD